MRKVLTLVKCELCGLSFSTITWMHLKFRHGKTLGEYQILFPEARMFSPEFIIRQSEAATLALANPETRRLRGEISSRNWALRPEDEKVSINKKISKSLLGNKNCSGRDLGEEGRRNLSEGINRYHSTHTVSLETRARIGRATKERNKNPEYIENMSQKLKEYWAVPGRKERMSALQAKKWEDPEFRAFMVSANSLEKNPEKSKNISKAVNKYWENPEAHKKASDFWKKKWAEDPEYQENQRLAYSKKGPNSHEEVLELILKENFPGEWKYVGNGEVILGGKKPDFININGKKLIIEFFGALRWHSPSEEAPRIEHFSHFGFRTLIVWGYELFDKDLVRRIENFMQDEAVGIVDPIEYASAE